MKNRVTIQATSLDLTPEALRRNLSPATMEALKGKKAHPWIIGETGGSRPRDLEAGGSRPMTWHRRAIQALKRAVKTGTKLFVGHGKGTNSHDGRIEVGSVLETFERELPDGKIQAIAVGILDSDRPDLDVCSIEAEVDIDENTGTVIDVPEVSAIALGSSRVDSPAFPGAVRLASMQFFGDSNDDDPEPKAKEDVKVTFGEVKNYIMEHGINPSKIYTPEDIREDARFGKLMGDDREAVARAEKAEADLKKASEELETLRTSSAENAKKVAKSEGRAALEKAIPEGMTEKQKKFLLDRFDPAGPEDLEEEKLSGYIENGTKEFAEYAKMFGDEASHQGGGEDNGESGDKKPEDKLLESILG